MCSRDGAVEEGRRGMDELSCEGNSLLPCLPEEVAWQCLVRLPRRHRALLSCVSRAWATACKNESFLRYLRRSLNLAPEFCVFIGVFDSRYEGEYVRASEDNTKWVVLLLDGTNIPTPTPAAQLLPNPLSAISNIEINLCSAATNNQIFLPQVVNRSGEGFSCYDVGEGRWKSVGLPPGKRRRKYCCGEMREFVYLCGGQIDFSGEASRSAFRYNTRNSQWEKLPDMIMARINCAGVSMNDQFYAVGGYCHSPAGFAEIHLSGERFDPETGEWTLLPNFCKNGIGLRIGHSGAVRGSEFAVVENKRLFAVQGESNEVMELDCLKEEWRHFGFIGGLSEMRTDCTVNFRILGVGSELWAFRFAVGKSIRIYSCNPAHQSESLTWIKIDVAGLEKFDHVLTATTLQVY